jgi:hypothetical protein
MKCCEYAPWQSDDCYSSKRALSQSGQGFFQASNLAKAPPTLLLKMMVSSFVNTNSSVEMLHDIPERQNDKLTKCCSTTFFWKLGLWRGQSVVDVWISRQWLNVYAYTATTIFENYFKFFFLSLKIFSLKDGKNRTSFVNWGLYYKSFYSWIKSQRAVS